MAWPPCAVLVTRKRPGSFEPGRGSSLPGRGIRRDGPSEWLVRRAGEAKRRPSAGWSAVRHQGSPERRPACGPRNAVKSQRRQVRLALPRVNLRFRSPSTAPIAVAGERTRVRSSADAAEPGRYPCWLRTGEQARSRRCGEGNAPRRRLVVADRTNNTPRSLATLRRPIVDPAAPATSTGHGSNRSRSAAKYARLR